MGAVSDLPVPQAGAVASLPNPTTAATDMDSAAAWSLTSNDLSRGIRSGFNQLGAMANAFMGNLGETAGLTEFAKSRMKDAEQYAVMADAVGPSVKDYRVIEDANTLSRYILGAAGQSAAQFVPALAGGAIGARLGGLRGSFVGLGAGSFIPNAGEQALDIKDMKGTPGEKTANMLGVGAINAALDSVTLGGAAARIAKPSLRNAGMLKTVGQGMAAEGITEGAQTYVGQAGKTLLDPKRNKAEDTHEIINSALQGAVGGGLVGGATRAAELAPGAALDGVAAAKKWMPEKTRDKFEEVVDDQPVPLDEDAELMKAARNPNAKETDFVEAMDRDEANNEKWLDKQWQRLKNQPMWEGVADWRDKPGEFRDYVTERYNESKLKPKIDQALKAGRTFREEFKKAWAERKAKKGEAPAAEPGTDIVKLSKQRTRLDDDILDYVSSQLGESTRKNMTPEQLIELADLVKGDAMHTFGQREEVEGPMPGSTRVHYTDKNSQDLGNWTGSDPLTQTTTTKGEQDRETKPLEMPGYLPYFFPSKAPGVIQRVQEMLMSHSEGADQQFRPMARADVENAQHETLHKAKRQSDDMSNIIRENMVDELRADSANREYYIRAFKELLNSNSEIDADSFRKLSDAVETLGKEKARLDPASHRLMEAAGMMFGGNRKKAMDQLSYLMELQHRDRHLFDDETYEKHGYNEDLTADGPMGDARARTYDSLESALEASKGIEESYGNKVRARISPDEKVDDKGNVVHTGKYNVSVHDAESTDTLSYSQWKKIQPYSDAKNLDAKRSSRGQSGFEHGVITARRRMVTSGGTVTVVDYKVSIPNLTGVAMASSRETGNGKLYNARMVLRGLSMLMADPNFMGLSDKTKAQLINGPKSWKSEVIGSQNMGDDNSPFAVKGDSSVPITRQTAGEMPKVTRQKKVKDDFGPTNEEWQQQIESWDIPSDTVVYVSKQAGGGHMTWGQVKETLGMYSRDSDVAKAESLVDAARTSPTLLDNDGTVPDLEELDMDKPYVEIKSQLDDLEKKYAEEARAATETYRLARSAVNMLSTAIQQNKDELTFTRVNEDGSTEKMTVQRDDFATQRVLARTARKNAFFASSTANKKLQRILGYQDQFEAEMDRRMSEGDFAMGETGMGNVDDPEASSRPSEKSRDPDGPRTFDEHGQLLGSGRDFDQQVTKFGKPVPGAALNHTDNTVTNLPGKGFDAHEVGMKEADRAPRNTRTATKNDDGTWTVRQYAPDGSYTETFVQRGSKLLQEVQEEEKALPSVKERKAATKALKAQIKSSPIQDAVEESKARKSSQTSTGPALSEDEAKAEINRLLGSQVGVEFVNNMGHAGEFSFINGVEKIKLASGASVGVLHHEAAHALFLRLIKSDVKLAHQLLSAAQSPHVMSRLRELLKNDPAALKQISSTEPGHAEERLAYMYQFWAAGALRVGPKTETMFDRVKGFFRAIAGVWSETFTDMNNAAKASQVMELFHSGALSDRNTVAEVLRDKMPKTPFDRATKAMPAVSDMIDKMFFTSTGIVKSMNVPALNDITDQFLPDSTSQGKKQGFLTAKMTAANRFQNVAMKLIGEADEATRRQALELLQGSTTVGTPQAHAIAGNVRTMLRSMFDYMVEAGVKAVDYDQVTKSYIEHDIGFVENYFPRYYDRQYITENRREFEAMLVRNGLTAGQARMTTDNVLRKSKVDPAANDTEAGLTFYAPNTMSRQLDVPAAELAPFLKKDLVGSLSSYITYATRRAEYTRRFGNQGQKIDDAINEAAQQGATPAQLAQFRQAVAAWDGSLGNDIDPTTKKVFGAITTYQNIRLLPLALFSSLVDPMGVAVRGGTLSDAFNTFVRGVRDLVSTNKDDAYYLSELVGSISSMTEAHMLADSYGNQYMSEGQRKINAAFFKFNGMESWNRSMRVGATVAAYNFILRHHQQPGPHSARYFSELGLEDGDVTVQNGRLVLNDQVVQAINRWVDGAIIRPNAGIRPIWMSDPHWMLVSHLKQFTYAFQKTIIARVVHEAENGNWSPAAHLMMYAPLILGADVLRAVLTPGSGDDDAIKRLTAAGLASRAVQRAGLVGPGQYALDAYGDLGYGKVPGSSFAGPAAQQVLDFAYEVANKRGGDVTGEVARALPGYPLFR